MELTQAFVLALVQGLTEFLPVSSSAHLVLLPLLISWPDQGLAFDVAVHVGTLIAVLVYFAGDVVVMIRDGVLSLARGHHLGSSRLAWLVMIATIPTGIAGLLVNAFAGDSLRSALVIAVANLVFAALLWFADARGRRQRSVATLSVVDALLIGTAQALALIPGASRAGVTMTAALALGLTRQAAARFSFLIAIPVIALAGGLKAYEAYTEQVVVDIGSLVLGVVVSALCALACIHVFLSLVERVGMLPFVAYRLALGVALLVFIV